MLHSFYTVLPIFYFTILPIAQFSAAKVWLWIIIIKMCVCVCRVGGGGGGGVEGWLVIYNPTKNPIKLEENRCSPNAYTFYKNNLKQIRRAGARRKWTLQHYILEASNFDFRYVRLCALEIPKEKFLNWLQTVGTLIRCRVLQRLIWVCTVCQLLL